MTIKEIETHSGMTRANIRFYESEGLLAPERGANGYRNYSQDDLDTLLRIRLLRSLRMPLEEIKRVHAGGCSLESALNRHLASLAQEQDEIDRSRRVCREMADHHADYRTLDAPRYLQSLAAPPVSSPVPATDVLPPVRAPWRRWFARNLDMALYSMLWTAFLMLVCNVNVAQRSSIGNIVDVLAGIILMLLIEPLLLHFFGTTPGKWLLGLSVSDLEERRLSVSAARSRTWDVLWSGMGLTLPVFQLVREWKSYQACASGEPLPWESDSTLTLRDERRWRYGAYGAAYAAVLLAIVLALSAAEMPAHRGDITVDEFAANFNRLAAYHQIDLGAELDETGQWLEYPDEPGAFVIHIGGEVEPPPFTFAEADGALTSVSFRYETTDSTIWPPSFQNQMTLTALAFGCTEEDFGVFSPAREAMLQTIAGNEFRSFRFEENGIVMTCSVVYSGYGSGVGLLLPEDGAETHYAIEFTIAKAD